MSIDETKPTIAFFDKNNKSGYTHVYGASRVIRDAVKDKFNIINIGAGFSTQDNYYRFTHSFTKHLIRKADSPLHYIQKNSKIIDEMLSESFKNLPVLDYIVLGTDDFFRLPLLNYAGIQSSTSSKYLYDMANEYFDYLGDDDELLRKIDEVNDSVISNWFKLVSPIAFSTRVNSVFLRSIKHLNDTGKIARKVIAFCIDPVFYTPYFYKNNIPVEFLYFANDTRGTRNFKQFDIGQFQHIIYDNKHKSCTLSDWDEKRQESTNKTKNLFFAGTIFQTKGQRKDMWDLFLKDIESNMCSYFIPLRKNTINSEKNKRVVRAEKLLSSDSAFTDLYNEIKEHKNYNGYLLPDELNAKTCMYKYGLVLRCISENDSLNFKPVLYTYMGTLPFLDYKYDPHYLQIPKHIQDKLVVGSSKDIDEKINFYNDNMVERLNVLQELNDLFKVNQYKNNPSLMIKKQLQNVFPEHF